MPACSHSIAPPWTDDDKSAAHTCSRMGVDRDRGPADAMTGGSMTTHNKAIGKNN